MSQKNKLIVSISAIFLLFAGLSVIMELMSEDNYKRAILKSRLESYIEIVANTDSVTQFVPFFPKDVRLSIIDLDGTVIFDTYESASLMGNHSCRPEIRKCLSDGEGYSIRKSSTSNLRYFYLAKRCDDRIIRAAQLYEVDLVQFSRIDWLLLLTIALLIGIAIIAVVFLSDRYEKQRAETADAETRRLKHEMTGNISHELKTPVSSIMGYLETIINHPELTEDKRQLFIERSYLQSLRLSDIIRDISIITKLEEAPEQYKIEPVNIKNVSEEVFDEMSSDIASHGITVVNEIPPVCIGANYNLLYAIFRNLIENTVKYGGEGCSIHLSYKVDEEGTHHFNYYDTGKGVDADQLDKIFERFYRLDADRGKPVGGSGLGLSIVRNAVLFHHGTVKAYLRSEGGLGFEFTFKNTVR